MIFRWRAAATAIPAAICAIGVPRSRAFTSPQLAAKPAARTQLCMGPPADPSAPLTERYGEGIRKYRRTVYTHDQWVKHRSSDRFVNNLSTLLQSGIYKQVGREVTFTVGVAVFVCVWNAFVGGYEDFLGVAHDPVVQGIKVGLPMQAFTLLSPSLGLLLVFRTNSSYNRWDEARKFWGLNINHTRDLNRMAAAWYGNMSNLDGTGFMGASLPEKAHPGAPPPKRGNLDPAKREYVLGQVSLMTWAFVRSMKRHLSPPAEDEADYVAEVRCRLAPKQAEALVGATHRPNRALYDLSIAIEKLPMHFVRKNEINKNLSIFEDTLGGSERLLSSPVPLFYSRHTARFLATWLLALPFGLYEPFANSWNHSMMIPATAFISVCLFGIEELATQLEEPFTILPMQGFCDKIGANCNEIVSWAGQAEATKALKAEESSGEGTAKAPSFADQHKAKAEVLETLVIEKSEEIVEAGPEFTMKKMAHTSTEIIASGADALEKGVEVKVEEGTPVSAAHQWKGLVKEDQMTEDTGKHVEVETLAVETLEERVKGLEKEAMPLEEEAKTLEETAALVAKKSEEGFEDFKPEVEAKIEEVEPKVEVKGEEVKPKLEAKIEEVKPKVEAKIEEVESKLEAKIEEVKPMAENRALRRMSLRERLGQIDAKLEVGNSRAAVEEARPEKEMEKIDSQRDGIENRAMRRMSLRERLSQIDARVSRVP